MTISAILSEFLGMNCVFCFYYLVISCWKDESSVHYLGSLEGSQFCTVTSTGKPSDINPG